MYALNTFLRLFRFISNSLLGLVVGFVLGLIVGQGGYQNILNYLNL